MGGIVKAGRLRTPILFTGRTAGVRSTPYRFSPCLGARPFWLRPEAALGAHAIALAPRPACLTAGLRVCYQAMTMSVIDIQPLTWEALFCCILVGIVIGLERQWHGKPMGMRTSALICIGTYVFVAISWQVATDVTDPSRIIGQVITGIGFLGAGVILARGGAVVGITSASAIWILAAIGVVIGAGFPWLGVKLAVLTVAILVGLDLIEHRLGLLRRGKQEEEEGEKVRR